MRQQTKIYPGREKTAAFWLSPSQCAQTTQNTDTMLGRLSVVRVAHSLSDLHIAKSSNHCKTDSLKSAVSERTHTRVSKWTTANYVIPCQLERDLSIKYLWGGKTVIATADLHIITGFGNMCFHVSSACKYEQYAEYDKGRLSGACSHSGQSDETWKQKVLENERECLPD